MSQSVANPHERDLFSEQVAEGASPGMRGDTARPSQPLAVRLRPRTVEEIAGQRHLLRPGSPLYRLVGSGGGDQAPSRAGSRVGMVSVILWGPPGTGKTTIAHVIAGSTGARFVELSAVSAGVKDVRQVMEQARTERELHRRSTVLFLDEIHRFSKSQQDALLPGVENGWVTLVAATTENPSFAVVAPLLSRSLMLTLQPLDEQDLHALVDRALQDPRGLDGRLSIDADAAAHLVRVASGDARRLLTALEAAAGIAEDTTTTDSTPERRVITLEAAEQAIAVAAVRYDKEGDQHYDVISAFIKSIRGSDVDASLHYLARMVVAGEDPRFSARRLMILASEDVGMADPSALQTAVAAAQAVALVGMPVARIILAEVVVHLATAPKSNAAYLGIEQALADVQAGRAGVVPLPLRDAHYPGAKRLGHGKGYRYAHDAQHGVARQQYLPDTLRGTRYYQPTQRGFEREVSARLERIRAILEPAPATPVKEPQ